MIRYFLLSVILVIFFACSEDLGINDFTYQCKTDNDCKEGYTCDKQKGCIRILSDAGMDVVSQDVKDIIDVEDIKDVEDITDIYDVMDAEEDVLDIEDISDIEDALDVEDVSDIEDVEDITDITDGGTDIQINYILRMESIYDSNAGICTSPNYIIESVTGFSASDEMKNSQYILHRSMLFKR